MTPDEYNKKRREEILKFQQYPLKTGIDCPHCGGEMEKADNCILTCNPPKKNIICPNCNYRDYMIV